MTVRQTPLTATLSPRESSGVIGAAIRRRKPPLITLRSISSPTASTSPVNIPFDDDVRTKRFDAPFEQRGGRESATREQFDAAVSQNVGRHVQPDVVDEPFVPRRRVNRGAAFEQQRSDLPLRREALERLAKAVARGVDRRARVFQRLPQF